MTTTETRTATCDAKIWPSWASSWQRCGSGIDPYSGRCLRYRHQVDPSRPMGACPYCGSGPFDLLKDGSVPEHKITEQDFFCCPGSEERPRSEIWLDRLAMVISDPGAVLPRREGETVARWAARALERTGMAKL
jgi:hypothetical protein